MATKTSSWLDADSDSEGEDLIAPKAPAPAPVHAAAPEPRYDKAPVEEKRNVPNRNGPFIIFVGNLNFNVTNNDLGNFFYRGGCDVADVKLQLDRETGKSRGFAHVEMKDLASLEKALKADDVEFMGRNIKVDVGKPLRRSDRPERGDRGDRPERGERPARGGYDRDRRGAEDNTPLERGLKVPGRDKPDRADKYKPAKGADAPAVASAPAGERKPLALKPRTKPVDDANKPKSYSSIFGEAKPREEKVEKTPSDSANAAPPAPTAEVEKKMNDLKVTPPSAPTGEDDKKAKAAVSGKDKERRPTKPTWAETRAGRGEGRATRGGDADKPRRERDGKPRGAGRDAARDQKPPAAVREQKPAGAAGGNKRGKGRGGEVTEEKGSSDARTVDTLAEHVEPSKVVAASKPKAPAKQTNMYEAFGASDSEED